MEIAILLLVVAVLAAGLLSTFKGLSAASEGADGTEEHAAIQFFRRYWWLAPLVIVASTFLL